MTNNEFTPSHPSHLITFRNQQNHFLQLSPLIHFRKRNHDPQNNSCDVISERRIVWCGHALKWPVALKTDWDCQDVPFQLNLLATEWFHSIMTMLPLPTHPVILDYQFSTSAHSFLGGLIKVICSLLYRKHQKSSISLLTLIPWKAADEQITCRNTHYGPDGN